MSRDQCWFRKALEKGCTDTTWKQTNENTWNVVSSSVLGC